MINLEKYMIPAMENNISNDNLLDEVIATFNQVKLLNAVDITRGSYKGTYDREAFDNVIVITSKAGLAKNTKEMRILANKIDLVAKAICKKNNLVLRGSFDHKSYQYICSLGDANTKYSDAEGFDRTIAFFGKAWNVKVQYEGVIPAEANKHIDAFIKKSSQISKSIEADFCNICNTYYSQVGIDSNITKYSEVEDLTCTRLIAMTEYKSDKIFIKLCGEYDVDCEHGWSLRFDNNKWSGRVGQFMDYE